MLLKNKVPKLKTYHAIGGSSAVEIKAKNMTEAIKKASVSFICNYHNKVREEKDNLILEYTVSPGKLPEDW